MPPKNELSQAILKPILKEVGDIGSALTKKLTYAPAENDTRHQASTSQAALHADYGSLLHIILPSENRDLHVSLSSFLYRNLRFLVGNDYFDVTNRNEPNDVCLANFHTKNDVGSSFSHRAIVFCELLQTFELVQAANTSRPAIEMYKDSLLLALDFICNVGKGYLSQRSQHYSFSEFLEEFPVSEFIPVQALPITNYSKMLYFKTGSQRRGASERAPGVTVESAVSSNHGQNQSLVQTFLKRKLEPTEYSENFDTDRKCLEEKIVQNLIIGTLVMRIRATKLLLKSIRVDSLFNATIVRNSRLYLDRTFINFLWFLNKIRTCDSVKDVFNFHFTAAVASWFVIFKFDPKKFNKNHHHATQAIEDFNFKADLNNILNCCGLETDTQAGSPGVNPLLKENYQCFIEKFRSLRPAFGDNHLHFTELLPGSAVCPIKAGSPSATKFQEEDNYYIIEGDDNIDTMKQILLLYFSEFYELDVVQNNKLLQLRLAASFFHFYLLLDPSAGRDVIERELYSISKDKLLVEYLIRETMIIFARVRLNGEQLAPVSESVELAFPYLKILDQENYLQTQKEFKATFDSRLKSQAEELKKKILSEIAKSDSNKIAIALDGKTQQYVGATKLMNILLHHPATGFKTIDVVEMDSGEHVYVGNWLSDYIFDLEEHDVVVTTIISDMALEGPFFKLDEELRDRIFLIPCGSHFINKLVGNIFHTDKEFSKLDSKIQAMFKNFFTEFKEDFIFGRGFEDLIRPVCFLDKLVEVNNKVKYKEQKIAIEDVNDEDKVLTEEEERKGIEDILDIFTPIFQVLSIIQQQDANLLQFFLALSYLSSYLSSQADNLYECEDDDKKNDNGSDNDNDNTQSDDSDSSEEDDDDAEKQIINTTINSTLSWDDDVDLTTSGEQIRKTIAMSLLSYTSTPLVVTTLLLIPSKTARTKKCKNIVKQVIENLLFDTKENKVLVRQQLIRIFNEFPEKNIKNEIEFIEELEKYSKNDDEEDDNIIEEGAVEAVKIITSLLVDVPPSQHAVETSNHQIAACWNKEINETAMIKTFLILHHDRYHTHKENKAAGERRQKFNNNYSNLFENLSNGEIRNFFLDVYNLVVIPSVKGYKTEKHGISIPSHLYSKLSENRTWRKASLGWGKKNNNNNKENPDEVPLFKLLQPIVERKVDNADDIKKYKEFLEEEEKELNLVHQTGNNRIRPEEEVEVPPEEDEEEVINLNKKKKNKK